MPFGIAQGDALPHRPQVEGRHLALRVGGPALELDRASREGAGEALHLERRLVETQGALGALETVGEAAYPKARAFQGEAAIDAGVGRGPAHADRRAAALPEPRRRRLKAASARRSAVPRAVIATAAEPSTAGLARDLEVGALAREMQGPEAQGAVRELEAAPARGS